MSDYAAVAGPALPYTVRVVDVGGRHVVVSPRDLARSNPHLRETRAAMRAERAARHNRGVGFAPMIADLLPMHVLRPRPDGSVVMFQRIHDGGTSLAYRPVMGEKVYETEPVTGYHRLIEFLDGVGEHAVPQEWGLSVPVSELTQTARTVVAGAEVELRLATVPGSLPMAPAVQFCESTASMVRRGAAEPFKIALEPDPLRFSRLALSGAVHGRLHRPFRT